MFTKTLLFLGLGAAHTIACTTAHVYMSNCALDGDIVSIQVWDNEVKVCNDGKTIYGASGETVYSFDCGNGRRADVSGNASKLTYYNDPENYRVDMQIVDGQGPNSYVCGGTDTRPINGAEYEYVFSDHYGDCGGKAQPQLCDYKTYCENGKGGGPGGSQRKRSIVFAA